MKILLIDDHKLFAMSIKMILEQYNVISEIDIISNEIDIEHINWIDYDIVLIDINLTNISDTSGLDLAECLIMRNIQTKVVLLTGHVKSMYKLRAKKIGAYGFIDKNIEPQQLVEILESINQGNKYFASDEVKMMSDKLTDQEINILTLLRVGKSIDEISQQIYISKRTVFNHLNNIYSKLEAGNKQEALYKAEQLGYFLDF